MSLTVSSQLLESTKTASLDRYRKYMKHLVANAHDDAECVIDAALLDTEGVADLTAAAQAVGDAKTVRALQSILLARSGQFGKTVPNFKAFQGVLEAFLRSDMIDGWIYVEGQDGKLYPQLVTGLEFKDGRDYRSKAPPSVVIHCIAYGAYRDGNFKQQFGVFEARHSFSPQAVTNRRIADILAGQGIHKETTVLREAHMASLARHRELTQHAFAKQFRVTGGACFYEEDNYERRDQRFEQRKVIHDLPGEDCDPIEPYAESFLFDEHGDSEGLGLPDGHPNSPTFGHLNSPTLATAR